MTGDPGGPEHGDRAAPADDRAALADDLARIGYLLGDLRGWDRGGGDSYFEKDLVLTRPGLLARVAAELELHVPGSCDRLAASGASSIALATALSLRTGIALVFVDVAADAVLGDGFPDAEVALVLDVILTGRSAAAELAILRANAFKPIITLALLDRGRGGRASIESAGTPVRALFSERDLVRA